MDIAEDTNVLSSEDVEVEESMLRQLCRVPKKMDGTVRGEDSMHC